MDNYEILYKALMELNSKKKINKFIEDNKIELQQGYISIARIPYSKKEIKKFLIKWDFSICGYCGHIKNKNEFYKDKRNLTGYRTYCIKCEKEYSGKNKEKMKLYQKKYYIENIEKLKKYKKQYYQDNKEKYNKS